MHNLQHLQIIRVGVGLKHDKADIADFVGQCLLWAIVDLRCIHETTHSGNI